MHENEDNVIKESLLKLASGYEYEEQEIIQDKNGGQPKIKVSKKHKPPEIAAITMIERLKRQGKW